jgi:16S rRNA (adenine1518-N6/adenine1519-N6)-dimethyltransferase
VGPGRGALTWGLLERAKGLDVIEIDRDLAQSCGRSARQGRLACTCRERAWTPTSHALRGDGAALRIVGNLPYNISTPCCFAC